MATRSTRLSQVPHLDSWMNEWQRADLLAFTALVELYLEPATVYTTWVEQHSYASHTAVRPAPDQSTTSVLTPPLSGAGYCGVCPVWG